MLDSREPTDIIESIKGMIAYLRLISPQAFDGEVRISSTLAVREALIACRKAKNPRREIPRYALAIKTFFGHPCEWYHTDEGAMFAALLNQREGVSYMYVCTPIPLTQVEKG